MYSLIIGRLKIPWPLPQAPPPPPPINEFCGTGSGKNIWRQDCLKLTFPPKKKLFQYAYDHTLETHSLKKR